MEDFDFKEAWAWGRVLMFCVLFVAASFGIGLGVGTAIWGF